jgi:hypothetical protein
MRKESIAPDALMGKLVKSIVEFLIRSGMKGDDLERVFLECLSEVTTSSASDKDSVHDSRFVGNGNVSAEVIRIWHRDGRFLDREARPRPLRLTHGPRSLGALVRKLDPTADHKKSIRAMRAVGLIRRLPDGRYIPTAESVTIDHLHPLAIEHVAKSVVRLVSTVSRNTDPARKAMSLIERYAYVPDLSKAEAVAFADFTRSQGMAYLEAVDDWLERRRSRRLPKSQRQADGNGVAAGVHIFAYLGDKGASPSRNKRWEGNQKAPTSRSSKLSIDLKKLPGPSRAARA